MIRQKKMEETNPAAQASCRTHPGRSASGSSAEASLTGSEQESCTIKSCQATRKTIVGTNHTQEQSQNEGKLKNISVEHC